MRRIFHLENITNEDFLQECRIRRNSIIVVATYIDTLYIENHVIFSWLCNFFANQITSLVSSFTGVLGSNMASHHGVVLEVHEQIFDELGLHRRTIYICLLYTSDAADE